MFCDLYIVPTTESVTSAVPTTDAESVATTTESVTEPDITPAETSVAPTTQSKYTSIYFKQILLSSDKYHMILQCIICNLDDLFSSGFVWSDYQTHHYIS